MERCVYINLYRRYLPQFSWEVKIVLLRTQVLLIRPPHTPFLFLVSLLIFKILTIFSKKNTFTIDGKTHNIMAQKKKNQLQTVLYRVPLWCMLITRTNMDQLVIPLCSFFVKNSWSSLTCSFPFTPHHEIMNQNWVINPKPFYQTKYSMSSQASINQNDLNILGTGWSIC